MNRNEYVLTELDNEFIGGTAEMIKDIISHCVFSYLKECEVGIHAGFVQNIFINAVGNGIKDLSEKHFFLENLDKFTEMWKRWIESAKKQYAAETKVIRKETHLRKEKH